MFLQSGLCNLIRVIRSHRLVTAHVEVPLGILSLVDSLRIHTFSVAWLQAARDYAFWSVAVTICCHLYLLRTLLKRSGPQLLYCTINS